MSWNSKIAGCFGSVDKVFAGHELEIMRAFELLAELRSRGEEWTKVRDALREYLESNNCTEEHIKKQLATAKAKFMPWLA